MASQLSTAPRRCFDSVVRGRKKLSGALDEPGVDLGGALLAVERRHVPAECGRGT
jgi:hypothetical protein